jgi:hypothetical protein
MPDSSAFIGIGTGAAEGLVAGFVKIGGETWWLSSGSEPSRRAGLPRRCAAGPPSGWNSKRGFAQ